MRFFLILLTTALSSICVYAQTADSLHLDVIISIDNGQLESGTCVDGGGGLACSSLAIFDILGEPPYLDFETGYNVFVSNFNDAAGGVNSVDDPGYYSVPGSLPPGLQISYEALGSLKYWDPATNEWSSNVPGNTQIVLFGKLTNRQGTPEECFPDFSCSCICRPDITGNYLTTRRTQNDIIPVLLASN